MADTEINNIDDMRLSIFDRTFWDLWVQKIFRNFASMKFQWLLLLYIPVIWGMFNISPVTKLPWISASEGLLFLGGGFITLAGSRLLARTSLKETNDSSDVLDTEQ